MSGVLGIAPRPLPTETEWKCYNTGTCGQWTCRKTTTTFLSSSGSRGGRARSPGERPGSSSFPPPSHLPPGERRKTERLCQRSNSPDSTGPTFTFGRLGWFAHQVMRRVSARGGWEYRSWLTLPGHEGPFSKLLKCINSGGLVMERIQDLVSSNNLQTGKMWPSKKGHLLKKNYI